MKIFKILFFIILINVVINAQIEFDKFNYSVWKYPPNIHSDLLIAFNASYDLFVFEKTQDSKYIANFSIQLEIYDSTYKLVDRNFIEANLKCNKYEQTISKDLIYSNSFTSDLPPDNYVARLTLFNKNKTNDIDVGSFKFSLIDSAEITPIIIREKDLKIIETDSSIIPFSNFVKFSPEKQLLLLPFFDNLTELKLTFRDSVIDLKRRMSKGLNYIFISLDSLPLIDELYSIKLKTGNSVLEIPLKVIWLNKPFTLKNFEFALQLMSYIFDESTIKKINKQDNKRKYHLFLEAWKKLDPTPKTAFNELLFEFYVRADVAVDKFKTITKPNGALTDRGKIFILYGNPYSIDRKFTTGGKATEIWNYKKNIKHQFTFIDENKNGNFILKNK